MSLTVKQIDAWIADDTRFEGKADGAGLMLRYRREDRRPVWLFRYRMSDGVQRRMTLGNIDKLPLSEARKMATLLNAEVITGKDPAGERQARKAAAVKARDAVVVNDALDSYYDAVVKRDWKDPKPIAYRLNMIRDSLGTMKVAEVRPADVEAMLRSIAARGAPTMANEALLWSKRLFRWAMKRELCSSNPADGFDRADAGGKRDARSRWLDEGEIKRLFVLMRSPNFGAINRLAVTLLLVLMVRKEELTGARRSEFDLDRGLWHLPADRTKTDTGQIIPLPDLAVDALRSLMQINPSSEWLLPARLWRTEGDQPMGAGTLNIALNKVVRPVFAVEGKAPFVLHDLRRTGRTWLSKLGIDFLVAERCLNHKLPGVSGVYDHDDRLEARKAALATWARSLVDMGATGAL